MNGEAGAWQAIKILGYPEMMATTVLRTFPPPSSTTTVGVVCSAQVMWPATLVTATAANLSESDVLKAGAFDYVANNTDRGPDGHNWMAVECERSGAVQLKLYDHAYCWDWPGRAEESVFVKMARGEPLPTEVLAGVERLGETVSTDGLTDFFDAQQRASIAARCRDLISGGCIPITRNSAA